MIGTKQWFFSSLWENDIFFEQGHVWLNDDEKQQLSFGEIIDMQSNDSTIKNNNNITTCACYLWKKITVDRWWWDDSSELHSHIMSVRIDELSIINAQWLIYWLNMFLNEKNLEFS